MLTDIELIRKIEFFETLELRVLKQIAEMCIVREFSSGEYIVRQGESGLGLYFITSGKAKVEIERQEAKVVVAELKEGDTLGEFSIIDDKARSANVICLEDTRCLLLTRDSFSKVMRKHPEIANQMLRTLVGRIRTVNERIVPNSPAAAAASPAKAQPEPSSNETPEPSADGLFEKVSGYLPPMPSLSDIPHPSEVFKLYTTTKTKTREYLTEMIGAIYAMKAMMRFSMAIVGCPVRVEAEPATSEVLAAEINGVKLVLFPAHKDHTLRIAAYDNGELKATVFSPRTGASVGPFMAQMTGAVERDRIYEIYLPADGTLALGGACEEQAGWQIQQSICD